MIILLLIFISMLFEDRIKKLIILKDFFADNLIGLEKESLRFTKDGYISQKSHPKVYGSALTNPIITTDFSESLIELITPALNNANKVIENLTNTECFVYNNLAEDEKFWHFSMPCMLNDNKDIPIAQYGNSNRGQMKTIYRKGIANRYGDKMQTIAGIHFNYSFSETFWLKYKELLQANTDLRTFKDCQYMALLRNFLRYGWLIQYLLGSSSTLFKDFLDKNNQKKFKELDKNTLYAPYATSLRMSNIGYQNSKEDAIGIKVNYNSLCHYINSIKSAIETDCEEWKKIGLKKDGEYLQLNTNILQIENEYYNTIRPKPKISGLQKPYEFLHKNGIHYIEIRSIDINPFTPLGIDKKQINFLEAFIVYCLLEESPIMSTVEQYNIDKNNDLVSNEGRKPNLIIKKQNENITLKEWGLDIVEKITFVAKTLLSKEHEKDVIDIAKGIKNPDLTPSAKIITTIKENNISLYNYIEKISIENKKRYQNKKLSKNVITEIEKIIKKSIKEQEKIEKADTISFDKFIQQYFSKNIKN